MEQVGNKISVITVVYNDVAHIRETMESYFSQTWEDKEYIVIDGGSTDGTADIIKEYADRLAYWCSEPDGGIYEAMNKGISHVSGDWINFLNSGDRYVNNKSLESLLQDGTDADVIYGNSIEINDSHKIAVEASSNISLMEFTPIYRHGSSITRTAVQRMFLFDTSRKDELGYALDWLSIYTIYKKGYKFHKVSSFIEEYLRDGTSDQALKSIHYIYKVTSQGKFSLHKKIVEWKNILKYYAGRSTLYRWATAIALEYIPNDILPHIPFWTIRRWYFRLMKMTIGTKSFIMKHNYIMTPNHLHIGDYSHINRGCLIDCRGGVFIGNNVSISYNVSIISGGHDINSKSFFGIYMPITIDDYAWLGANSTILQNVTVGKGAVVCAGAVVTKDVAPYTIVGGVPAKVIGHRTRDLDYHCIWNTPLT